MMFKIVGALALLAALGGYIWLQNGQIEKQQDEIALLKANLINCKLSQQNIKEKLEAQNGFIEKYNDSLLSTNKELSEIEKKNQVLQKEIKKKITEINKVQNETCQDTINWMLEEAIDENITTTDSAD